MRQNPLDIPKMLGDKSLLFHKKSLFWRTSYLLKVFRQYPISNWQSKKGFFYKI